MELPCVSEEDLTLYVMDQALKNKGSIFGNVVNDWVIPNIKYGKNFFIFETSRDRKFFQSTRKILRIYFDIYEDYKNFEKIFDNQQIELENSFPRFENLPVEMKENIARYNHIDMDKITKHIKFTDAQTNISIVAFACIGTIPLDFDVNALMISYEKLIYVYPDVDANLSDLLDKVSTKKICTASSFLKKSKINSLYMAFDMLSSGWRIQGLKNLSISPESDKQCYMCCENNDKSIYLCCFRSAICVSCASKYLARTSVCPVCRKIIDFF